MIMRKQQSNPIKKDKPNLFVNDNPDELESIRKQVLTKDMHKIMFRIDHRTHILVAPEDATPEHIEKLRMRYKIKYALPAKGGRKKQ